MESAYRASFCKLILNEFLAYPGNPVAADRSLLPAESVRTIEETPGVGWVPHGVYSLLLEMMGATLSIEQFKDCWHRINVATMRSHPFGKVAVVAASKLFGLTPFALCRVFDKAWKNVARESGCFSAQPLGDGCLLLLDEYPTQFFTPSLVAAFEGGVRGLLTTSRTEGSVTTQATDRATGHAEYRLRF